MRRLLLSLLLPLLMLFAQQGAVTHEIGHLGGQRTSSERGKQDAAEPLCLSCLSHADLNGIARPDAFVQSLHSAAHSLPLALPAVATLAQTLQPRSRGPPFFL